MTENLKQIIEHENTNWSRIFEEELQNSSSEKFSSFWWEDYYTKLIGFINNLISELDIKSVLEAGCGSGKATILLKKELHKTLLDISPAALNFAKYTSKKFEQENMSFKEGDMFSMPFKDHEFDFVWILVQLNIMSKKK